VTDAQTLRAHAERCRRLAKSATDRDVARILTDLAVEYEDRVKRLERQEDALSQPPAAVAEQSPMQQQQQIQPKKDDAI